jgi:hypothetical protein
MYLGLGSQLAQMQISMDLGNADGLFGVAVLRKGKHALRR